MLEIVAIRYIWDIVCIWICMVDKRKVAYSNVRIGVSNISSIYYMKSTR